MGGGTAEPGPWYVELEDGEAFGGPTLGGGLAGGGGTDGGGGDVGGGGIGFFSLPISIAMILCLTLSTSSLNGGQGLIPVRPCW